MHDSQGASAMVPAGVLIDCAGVERWYAAGDTKVFALRGVDLTVGNGEYLSLMGPSGSGKTTLFNMIGALDVPTTGRISIGGQTLKNMNSSQLAALRCLYVGYIFQTYNLIEVLTALENVILPMRFVGLGEKAAKAKAADLLTRVDLGKRMHHRPSQLSGGQQQRVAIARALANDPKLILADEPTGNLDSKTSLAVVELLSELSKERGVTVVSATHDHKMLDVSDRIVFLRDGKVEKIVAGSDLKNTEGAPRA